MVEFDDIRPVFRAAKLFGCVFHVITENDVKVTKRSVICSVACSIIHLICGFMSIYVYTVHNPLNQKLWALTFTRQFFAFSSLLGDITLTTLRNWKIRAALSELRKFDRATNFKGSGKGSKIPHACIIAMVLNLIFWSYGAYVNFGCETVTLFLLGASYAVVNTGISIQILIFVSFTLLLHDRFDRLCKMLMFTEEKSEITLLDRLNGQFKIREVWWLHYCLANATEMINSTYTIQLFTWITSMSFNTLSRIYMLMGYAEIPVLIRIRELMLVTICVGNLFLIAAMCHAVAHQANQVGEVLFLPLSPFLVKPNFAQEDMEALAYFQLRKVHFFAIPGFIRIDLSLLLSIASGITTYVVILRGANNE